MTYHIGHVEIYPHHHLNFKARLDLPGDYALLTLKEMIGLKNALQELIATVIESNAQEAQIISETNHEIRA